MLSPVVKPRLHSASPGVSHLKLFEKRLISTPNEDLDTLLDDQNLLDSTSIQSPYKHPKLSWLSKDNLSLLGICLLLVVVMTSEAIIRRANGHIYMANYRTFLNQVIVFFCTIGFFGIIAYNKYVRNEFIPTSNRRMLLWFLAICLFDTVAAYMIMLSSATVSAPLATLLAQGAIPITMFFSYSLLSRRFKFVHYLGALIIMVGLAISIGSTWSHEAKSDSLGSSFGWALVLFLANIPIALGCIFKEVLLVHPDDSLRPDMHQMNAWVAFFQFIIGIALYPAGFLVEESGRHISDVGKNIVGGFVCWLTGDNYIEGDDCSAAPILLWVHILIVVILNILVLIVIFRGSAVLLFIAGAASIPMASLFSAFAFMGEIQVHFEWLDIICVLLTMVGLITYRLKPEE